LVLSRLFHQHGGPQWLRRDNSPEFLAKLRRTWLGEQAIGTLSIEPGCPWQNGKGERFNGRFRDARLNGEIVLNLAKARIRLEHWREQRNTERPHRSLGYRTPYEFNQAVRF
jgi:putative transposase